MAARRSRRRQTPHWLAALAVGMLLGAGIAIGVQLAWHGHPRQTPPSASSGRPPRQSPSARHPTTPPPTHHPAPAPPVSVPPVPAQNPEASQAPAIAPGSEAPPPTRAGRPRVAIIFDDAGYSLRAAREVMDLGRPVTISVLPGLPYSTPVAEEAPQHGVQVILHLPMEAENTALPLGPGGITVDMSDQQIRKTVDEDFASVPTAMGLNNHMGSLGTSDPRVMRAVIETVKARRLFFVDSLTSHHSVAAQVAREMGVPTAVRAVFLDNQDDVAYVRGQLHALIKVALSRGQAIAIGHVGKVTAAVLRAMLPEFDEAGIQLVPVSQLVR